MNVTVGYFIASSFDRIEHSGLVAIGSRNSGIVEEGDKLEFLLDGKLYDISVEKVEFMLTVSGKALTGLLISPPEELEKGLKNQIALECSIIRPDFKLKDLSSWICNLSDKEKKDFLFNFLKEIPVMNRGIWSDEEYSSEMVVEGLKWSNELCYKLWNLYSDSKMDGYEGFAKRLCDYLEFYESKQKELSSHLGGTIKFVVENFHKKDGR